MELRRGVDTRVMTSAMIRFHGFSKSSVGQSVDAKNARRRPRETHGAR